MKPADLAKVKQTLKLTPYPVNLVLEATTYCNLRCLACPYSKMKREKGQMDEKLYQKIIKEIADNSPEETIIWFAFMGEPVSLGKQLFDWIKYAKEKGVKNTYLNTNAIFFNEEMANLAITSGLDKIIISIDAFKPESYERIRKGGNYEVLKKNILYLLSLIKEKKVKKPEVMVQFIVMDENRDEEEDFKKYWLARGATVKIRRKMGWGGTINSDDLIIAQKDRNMPCSWLMRQMIILWDGKVSQCDADYEGIYCAGNINNQTIYEVWNVEQKIKRLRHLNNDFDFLPCKQCNDWQVGLSEFYKPN